MNSQRFFDHNTYKVWASDDGVTWTESESRGTISFSPLLMTCEMCCEKCGSGTPVECEGSCEDLPVTCLDCDGE